MEEEVAVEDLGLLIISSRKQKTHNCKKSPTMGW